MLLSRRPSHRPSSAVSVPPHSVTSYLRRIWATFVRIVSKTHAPRKNYGRYCYSCVLGAYATRRSQLHAREEEVIHPKYPPIALKRNPVVSSGQWLFSK